MCEHCGCRQVEPLADLMDEHFALLELSGDIRRAFAVADRPAAFEALSELGRQLDAHVGREERGVFAALKAQGDFVEAVDALEQEHVSFDEALSELDPADPGVQRAVEGLLDELSEHIDKENLGIFPVAVVALGATGWDTVLRAHAS